MDRDEYGNDIGKRYYRIIDGKKKFYTELPQPYKRSCKYDAAYSKIDSFGSDSKEIQEVIMNTKFTAKDKKLGLEEIANLAVYNNKTNSMTLEYIVDNIYKRNFKDNEDIIEVLLNHPSVTKKITYFVFRYAIRNAKIELLRKMIYHKFLDDYMLEAMTNYAVDNSIHELILDISKLNLPINLINKILQIKDSNKISKEIIITIFYNILDNDNITGEMIESIYRYDKEEFSLFVSESELVNPTILDEIASINNQAVYNIAINPNTLSITLDKICLHKDEWVRFEVASHDNTLESTLVKIINNEGIDPDALSEDIMANIYERKDVSLSTKEMILRRWDLAS